MFYFVENMPGPTASVRSVCINHTINGMDELFELFKKKLEFPYPYSTEGDYIRQYPKIRGFASE